MTSSLSPVTVLTPEVGLPRALRWTRGRRAGVFSSGVNRIPHLAAFFDFDEIVYRPSARDAARIDLLLVWGNKQTGRSAHRYADDHAKPVWRLEDGFFRSVNSGPNEAPLSLVIDDRGIYYDATRPSRLETILQESESDVFSLALLERAQSVLSDVLAEGLSKYNSGARECSLPPSTRTRILLVDQTRADASIEGGLASAHTFREMFEWARNEFPAAELVIKTHPDVVSGRKASCFPREVLKDSCVTIVESLVEPRALFKLVDHVVTATSQLGFEALCAGKPVTCFGAPFYAGWGLTNDKCDVPRRSRNRTLPELVAAAWLLYPSYCDPVSGRRCTPEFALAHLARQRRANVHNSGHTVALGFSRWKRPFMRPFLQGSDTPVSFCKEGTLGRRLQQQHVDRVVVWGQRIAEQDERALERAKVPLLRVEDGFLRSSDLGSDLTRPSSIVLDGRGLYYDATRPSDLEVILSEYAFGDSERRSGRQIIEKVVRNRLSKYNVQDDSPVPIPDEARGRVLLVVGQVSDDASIRLGTRQFTSNGQLLRAVREANPEAFILYKPHPDVVSGNRRGALREEDMRWAHRVEQQRSIVACLDVAQEVHTMTSLVGFEALLRGLPVHTYGLPFYAGWGLTQDAEVAPRRGRQLALEELAFAAFSLYPLYYSARHRCFISVEQAIEELVAVREAHGRADVAPSFSRKMRRLRRFLGGWTHGA